MFVNKKTTYLLTYLHKLVPEWQTILKFDDGGGGGASWSSLRHAKFQSHHHHQHTILNFYTWDATRDATNSVKALTVPKSSYTFDVIHPMY